eukprot:Rhum_TRINITY_DN14356_c17_g1::Rhum_TRINITY_DN14356_c17_g1_i1::g.84616::m.84616
MECCDTFFFFFFFLFFFLSVAPFTIIIPVGFLVFVGIGVDGTDDMGWQVEIVNKVWTTDGVHGGGCGGGGLSHFALTLSDIFLKKESPLVFPLFFFSSFFFFFFFLLFFSSF